MPELDAERREQLAEALAEHYDPTQCVRHGMRDDVPMVAEHARHVADALAPLIAGWLAEAWDAALDDAAHEVAHSVMPNHPNAGYRDGHAHAEQVIRSLIGATRGGGDG